MHKVDFVKKYSNYSVTGITTQQMLRDLESVIKFHKDDVPMKPRIFRDLTDKEHKAFLEAWQNSIKSKTI
jgi:hypothetical protein